VPDWNSLVDEVQDAGATHDIVRRKYLKRLQQYTKRNVIVYYSAWLQKSSLARKGVSGFEINDLDKNALMATIYQLDRDKGLDLFLHTPGGDIAATESLVDYLHSLFGEDIRVVVPQLAMSAGTMIAFAGREIVMGKHSSLGPFDPQLGGTPVMAIIDEWNRATEETRVDSVRGQFWAQIIRNYPPGLVGSAEHLRDWAQSLVTKWLTECMFKDKDDPAACAKEVVDELGSHAATKAHNRHISAQKARDLGLNVAMLENDQRLQERVLTVHHACMLSLSDQPIIKLIENHNGIAYNQLYELT